VALRTFLKWGGVEEAELDEFVARSLNEEFPWPPRTRARRDYRTESGRASEGVLEQHSPPAEEDATLEWPAVRAAEVEAAKKEEAEEGILEGVRALAAQSGKTVEEVERDLREAVRALGIQQEAQKEAQEEARSKAKDKGNGEEVTKR